MSVNTDPSKGCRGKKPYRTFTHAEKVASASAEKERQPFHAYHCKHCNSFHVGTHFRKRKPEVRCD